MNRLYYEKCALLIYNYYKMDEENCESSVTSIKIKQSVK